MQIKELEDEFKVSLIERRKSGVHFTEHGEEVTRRARAILASVRQDYQLIEKLASVLRADDGFDRRRFAKAVVSAK